MSDLRLKLAMVQCHQENLDQVSDAALDEIDAIVNERLLDSLELVYSETPIL